MPRPPASPLGCGLTQRGLAERRTPQESGGLATQRWERAVLSELQLQAPTPLGSQQRSRALLECLVGGSCDSCWKNRRPPKGTESHPEVSKCGKHPDLQGEGWGGWMWSLGPWGRRLDAPRGQGERKTASFTPRRPVGASQRHPAGSRGGGPALCCAGGGGLGRNLAICLGKHPTSELGWQAPASQSGGCRGILFIGAARRSPAQHPLPAQPWVWWAVGTGWPPCAAG